MTTAPAVGVPKGGGAVRGIGEKFSVGGATGTGSATAKAHIEGLTRALAVDYGPRGIRTNAVALGSIATEQYEALLRDSATSRRTWAVCIRSAGSDGRTRSLRSSPTCCPRRPASSTLRSSRSMVGMPFWEADPEAREP